MRKFRTSSIAASLVLAGLSSFHVHSAVALSPLEDESVERIKIQGQASDASFPYNLSIIEEGKILAGKKVSEVNLSDQPVLVEPNLRQVFATLPGIFVSDQKIPSIYNVNYRGLGNPHESEFVAFFQDGIPLASDMFGYATIYYLPAAQRIERAQFIRGGAGLLYGPQIGPSINFVTKRARVGAENSASTEHSFGNEGFYSTYNEFVYSSGDVGIMASIDHRQADGPRTNEDYELTAGYVGIEYAGFKDVVLGFDLDLYQSDSGEAGRLSSDEFDQNRDQTLTPFNRIEIERYIAALRYEQQLSADATLNAKIWNSYQDRFSRRSAQFTNPANEPSTTNIDQQEFDTFGADIRFATAWGVDHLFTLGTTLYRDDSPRTRHVSDDIRSNAQDAQDLRFDQDRVITYSAIFMENLFRFGDWSVSPTLRYERVNYDIREIQKNPSLNRDALDIDQTHSDLLFGLGTSYRLSNNTQLYANISESYRPQRFDDVANPNAELAGENGPDLSTAINYEFGLRSSPVSGFNFDVSLFRIDFENKIETQQVNISDIIRVNSGDSRHQGVEFTVEFDLFANASGEKSLRLFANGSILDAEIVNSNNAALVGNAPAFAPDHLFRMGLIYDSGEGLNAALTATMVDDQFWQDSNQPRGEGFDEIDALIPAYEVLDLSTEYEINASWSVYAGINNLLDENYYSRVRNDGIEPAAERTYYAGFRFTL
ncbi:TonB-dependent receptor family protein [Ningiella sp. W23]|uniref:TonB-dependent receptor family protein n=1 Tax=Ningiella sp. W23 TaxID=3023715 RepID=UPI0037576666